VTVGQPELPKPTRCERCREEFMARPSLQAEARHIAAKAGASAAEAFVNDALEDEHAADHPRLGFKTIPAEGRAFRKAMKERRKR
jgi:hypothetical protein